MIYFIKRPDNGRIKIGTTIRLSERLKQLVAEYGTELEVLAVADGSFDQEQELHRRFAHLRHGRSEMFEPGDDLVGFIVTEGRPWDGTDEVPPPPSERFGLRVSPAWKEWLVDLANHRRRDKADVIDEALEDYAVKHLFRKPPKR